jgi:hypothetical protein
LRGGSETERRAGPKCARSDGPVIYENRVGPNSQRWFWSMTVTGPITRWDRVATFEEAKAQLRKSWDAWKVWANLEEIDSGQGPHRFRSHCFGDASGQP